ncbi:hypothetical protein OROHE_002186 [Orobanche hederae]
MTSILAPLETKEQSESDSSNPENQNSDSSQSDETTAAQDRRPMKKVKNNAPLTKRKRERKAIALRSIVWEHFEKYDEPLMEKVDGTLTQVGSYKRAECKHCHASLVGDSRGGTSSLKKHLDCHCVAYPGSLNYENREDGNQTHISSDLVDGFKRLTTRVWSQEACIDAATKMIVIDELPFSAIERPGFRHFCDVAVPRFIPPCRKSHQVCLTTDTWTSCQNINYMVITAHFIDYGWKMHKRILKFCVVPNHSGSTIGKILEDALTEWGIEKVLTISVDNAASNKIGIDYLRKRMMGWERKPICAGMFSHVRCYAHTVNLVVKAGLKEMEKSIAAIRNAIRFVRSSAARTKAFKKCVEKDNIECKKICILDVPTRWNCWDSVPKTKAQWKR